MPSNIKSGDIRPWLAAIRRAEADRVIAAREADTSRREVGCLLERRSALAKKVQAAQDALDRSQTVLKRYRVSVYLMGGYIALDGILALIRVLS